MKKLILTACIALLLTGCAGKTKDTNKDNDKNATVSSERDWRDDYNSHVFYYCEDASDNAELEDIARILENRYTQMCGSDDHKMSIDYEKKVVALWFNNGGNGDRFAEISPLENRIRFIDGNDESGEVALTNENIASCVNIKQTDADTGKDTWYLEIEFNDEGTNILKDIAEGSEGSDKYLSIWLNGNYVSKLVIDDSVTDGKVQITYTNFTEEYTQSLAQKISMKPLPFDLMVKEQTILTTYN